MQDRTSRLYVTGGFDRSTSRRDDGAWLERALEKDALVVPVWRNKSLLHAEEPSAAVFVPAATVAQIAPLDAPVFLGVGTPDVPYVACSISAADESTALARLGLDAEGGRFVDLRGLASAIAPFEFGLLAYARALVYWNMRTLFCNVCGAPTRSISAGHVRECTNPEDATRHFPRSDPAAIMLVHDGDRALLGRQRSWAAGRYSTLAGFAEPGESLEDAVIREVREESGIAVDDVSYFASQPWPFPQSLMLGFFARAASTEIVVGDELEDARWFTRDEIRTLIAGGKISVPSLDTIARRLIDTWIAGLHE